MRSQPGETPDQTCSGHNSGIGGAPGIVVDAGGLGGAPGIDAQPQEIGGPDAQPVVKSPFITIAIGKAHACGARADHTIDCIGDNSKGQATPPPGLYYGVSAGDDFTCASQMDKSDITRNGAVVCWGDNTYGQASPPLGVKNVSAGARHACGSRDDDSVVCWGDNSSGQATPPAGALVNLAAGRAHTCATKFSDPANCQSATLVCWGDNSHAQSTPPPIRLSCVTYLSAGGDHTCVNDYGDQAWCWGDGTGGQSTPPFGSMVSLAVAPGHACGISVSHKILCWGQDWGDATPVPPSGEFSNLWAGEYSTCAQPYDQTQPVVCWGPSYQLWP
ncbi:MAG TPA: RCC1 domain-containing protein [Polyangia bacterium]|nr:RCC1 domain-containing protein [Polyangia bacterium]